MSFGSTKGLRSACAVAAVATCWGVGQQANAGVPAGTDVMTTLTTTTPVSNLYLLYRLNSSGFQVYADAVALPDANIGANVFSVNLQFASAGDLNNSEFSYTLAGIYSDPTNPEPGEQRGVSITLEQAYAGDPILMDGLAFTASGPAEFDDVFTFSESGLITALQNGDITFLSGLLSNSSFDISYGFPRTYELTSQINFSTADFAGTATLAIPEPASLGALGLAGLLLRRRR